MNVRSEMDFGDRSDNPFAVPFNGKKSSRRKSLVSAAKFFALIAVALGAILVVSSQSQRWLVYQLTQDFDALGAKEKSVRLVQIAELGAVGVEPLVRAMTDEDVEVARTAYEMLRQSQNEWTVLEEDQRLNRHELLIDSLRSIAIDLDDDRTGWGTNLLQQTMVAALDRDEESSQKIYSRASEAMQLYALTERPGPSVLIKDSDSDTPRRLVVTSKPLPVADANSVDHWTNWPPQKETSARISHADAGTEANAKSGPVQTLNASLADRSPGNASVYKSTANRLREVDSEENVALRELASFESGTDDAAVKSATHLVDSPMSTFDDVSVMRWLGSPHQALREKAKLELISRGYDGTAITIATRIAAGDVPTRLALVDALANANAVDPRPWLLMLLQDDNRDVKLKVISVLGTMSDPEIAGKLQMHLVDETDPTVAARIRRVLKLR
ncbi:MAG: HEAT repeat domain-containing protein [Rubripirellula sp.]